MAATRDVSYELLFAWFDEDNITVYTDDPVCAPTMKEIYG